MPMSAAVDAMERLHDYEELDRSMQGDYAGATIDDVDEDAVRRTLGDTAAQDLRRLKQIERMLEEAGLVQRRRGRLEVTPRGARKLGERALTQIFEELQRDREGTHESRDAGGLAEPTGATRPWNFGDHGQLAVQRTVFNAVHEVDARRAGAPGPRRLRDDRGGAAHRNGHRLAARSLVLDAAARALHPREEDGARAARVDRGPLSARHALPDRLQRLRAEAATRGPHRARVRARVRHEHATRVHAGEPAALAAPSCDATGDHGDRRRADGAPRGGAGVLLVAAGCPRRSS